MLLPRINATTPRRDQIPAGSYIVPWMKPSPSVESIENLSTQSVTGPPWDVEAVMAGALKLNINFSVTLPNETRSIRSTVYLGHDSDFLYVGGEFRGMYRNPTSTGRVAYTDYFVLLLDVANDGALTFPESGSRFSVALHENAGWHTGMVWSVQDQVWLDNVPAVRRAAWVNGYDAHLQVSTARSFASEYDNSTGTVIMLYSRYLQKAGFYTDNALQMKVGERWTMGFLLELAYSNDSSGAYQDFVDGWPRTAYPYLDNDASWWPKLVIDLTNPPPSY